MTGVGSTGAGGLVAVLGRRYDVDVAARSLLPVYWECAPGAVRRCSWFSRGVHESKFMPYEEHVAGKLEVRSNYFSFPGSGICT